MLESPVSKVKIHGRGSWAIHELLYHAIEKCRESLAIVPLDALPHRVHLPKRSGTDLSRKTPAKLEVVIPETVAKALQGGQNGDRPMIVMVEIPAGILQRLTSPIVLP